MLNNESEFDRKSDSPGGNRSGAAVVEGGDHDERPVDSGGGGSGEIRVSSREEELESGAPVDARVFVESGSDRGVDADMDSRADFEVKDEEATCGDRLDYGEDQFDVKTDQSSIQDDRPCSHSEVLDAKNGVVEELGTPGRSVEVEKHVGLEYKSLLSEFDDYVASEKSVISRANRYGFEVGDMIWGKVKSHPWWPGHIFNEAFATASVRRVRSDGLVLVAFFGDSSYGWFDPAELVPFDPNFTEKCQQTNSRTFVKAVEEAVDELSRRRGLGVVCKCRNPFNFRPAVVKDYYAVDVPDYEPGGVYSETQIRKARDGFDPGGTLHFIKQLALTPRDSDQKNIEFVKKKATVFAYRKAVFEEFDETYAQAFGVQGARSSRDLSASEQPVKMPRLAPFSGPLVIAETLGSGKSSVKSPKVKEHSKKDRYLFKRRNESSNTKVHQINQGAISSPSLAYMEGSPALAAGDFVLQKRTPDLTVKPEIRAIHNSGSISTDGACLNQVVSNKAESMDQTPVHPSSPEKQYASLDRKSSLAMEKAPSEINSNLITGSSSTSLKTRDVKHEEVVNVSVSCEGFQQPGPSLLTKVEEGHAVDQVHGAVSGAHSLPVDVKRVVGVKKTKVVKKVRMGDSRSDISILGEKKTKKKKRELGSEPSPDHPPKRLATGKGGSSVGKLPGKSAFIGVVGGKEDPQLNHQKKNDGANNSVPTSVWSMLRVGELNVPQLFTDLQSLALVPFHGVERNSSATIREFFGKFRSDAFQKSQKNSVPSQATDAGGFDVRPLQSVAREDVNDVAGERAEGSELPSKPVKTLVRSNDPTKAGRKRGPSDRQEENAAKKAKRMNDLKSTSTEKKANPKTQESQHTEGKKTAPSKASVRPDARRVEPSAKLAEPTMLVMRFPPQTSLPSVAELKARFARFGPLDHMAIRVFWKTSMCRVVFRHKRDAQNALKYASVNNNLFGNVNVRYYIREIGAEPAAAEVAESGLNSINSSIDKDHLAERPRLHQPVQQPAGQLKSILKRSTGEEAAGSNGGGRGTPRVKFMLGGEETATGSGEQMAVGNKNNKAIATNVATMDFNNQKMNPCETVKPVLPSPLHNQEIVKTEAEAPNSNIYMHSTTKGDIDISEQMVKLLTRCNDVVLNLSALLGYVPYHPL